MLLLDEYLEEVDSKPWQWGVIDCIMRQANWVWQVSGIDPAQAYRGKYSTALGALRLVERAGGMVSIVTPGMATAGWQRTDYPELGDVGIVMAPSALDEKLKEIGAMCYGPWWSLRAEEDVVFSKDFPVVAAWTARKVIR